MIDKTLAAQYFPITVMFGIAVILAVVLGLASYLFAKQKPYKDKNLPYECGFDAFTNVRGKFDIRYYLVAILFIIFDIEVAFLFPWAVGLGTIGIFGYVSMAIFLGILTVGFIYEWRKGALEWD